MKKLTIGLLILALSLSVTACGGKGAKTETTSSDETSEQTTTEQTDSNTDEISNETRTLSTENEVFSMNIAIPEGFTETAYSTEVSRSFERDGAKGGLTQYTLMLSGDSEASVEELMKQQVNYLLSANSDKSTGDIAVSTMDYGAKTWKYFAYSLDNLDGYRIWTELPDGGVFTCTAEWLDGEKASSIDQVIKLLSAMIAVHSV